MDKCLIIAANNNILTFKATLIAIRNKWESKESRIKTIVIIRNLSDESKEKIALCKQICEELLPKHEEYIEKRVTSNNEYSVKLPIIFRDILVNFSEKGIVVDLTNGTKTFADFAYLACTLLNIENVFRVKIPKEVYKNQNIEENERLTINKEIVLSREDLRNLVNKTYSEYIFYYKEIEQISEWIPKLCLDFDSNRFIEKMLSIFRKYISNDYEGCIINLSMEMEYILEKALDALSQKFNYNTWNWLIGNDSFQRERNQNNINRVQSLGTKAHTLANILNRANKIITQVNDNSTNLPEVDEIRKNVNIKKFAPIIPIGYTLQSMTIIRNFSSHTNKYSLHNRTINDAQYQINAMLYVLKKMKSCELLGGEN